MTELEKDAARYRWLKEALQVAYDGDSVDYGDISVSCRMLFGSGEYRRVEATVNFADKREEEINLDAAIDRVMPALILTSRQLGDAQTVPCLYELDSKGEATGTVMPFCSMDCLEKVVSTTHRDWAKGTSRIGDFGYIPHCEECGKELG